MSGAEQWTFKVRIRIKRQQNSIQCANYKFELKKLVELRSVLSELYNYLYYSESLGVLTFLMLITNIGNERRWSKYKHTANTPTVSLWIYRVAQWFDSV